MFIFPVKVKLEAMMERKTIFRMMAAAVLALLLAVSCSPAPEKEKLDRIPMEGNPKTVEIDSSFDTRLRISFPPVRGASSYEVRTVSEDGTDERTMKVDLMKNWNDGLLTLEVRGLSSDTGYRVSILAYGKDPAPLEIDCGIWRTLPSTGDIDGRRPAAWLEGISGMEGSTFSADITVERKKDLQYRAVVIPDPGSTLAEDAPFIVDIPSGDGRITVSTGERKISSSAFINVEHGKAAGDKTLWGSEPTVIKFPENIHLYDGNLELTVTDDGFFSWAGAASADGTVSLYRHTEQNGTEYMNTARGKDGSGNFGEWRDPNGLESALWFVTDGNTVSNPVFLTSCPVITVETTQTGVTLRWKAPEGVEIAYSGIPEPELIDGWMVSTETGLDSRSVYTRTLKAVFSDGRKTEETVTFETGSFAGKYRWQDLVSGPEKNAGNFIVNVVDAPEGSSFKYHVWTDPADKKCIDDGDETQYRLMPLFDEGLGEKIPEDPISFSSDSTGAAKAYLWNESKWNSSSAHPKTWIPVSTVIDGDRTTSKVKTSAMFGIKVTTQTDMEFFVGPDGKPMMRFRNMAVDGPVSIVNGSLNINHIPRTELGEDSYTYVLEYIGKPEVKR